MKLIVKVIFKFLSVVITAVTLPLNTLIEGLMPSLSNALASVTSMFTWLEGFTTFVLSWLPFDSNFYAFVIASLTFIYTIPIAVSLVKLVVKWWHALAP